MMSRHESSDRLQSDKTDFKFCFGVIGIHIEIVTSTFICFNSFMTAALPQFGTLAKSSKIKLENQEDSVLSGQNNLRFIFVLLRWLISVQPFNLDD